MSRDEQKLMDWPIFDRVVQNLAKHEYAAWFAFHNYNEPLLNPRLPDEIRHVRCALPSAKPVVFTNGDLLNPGLLEQLANCGLRSMRITTYGRPQNTSHGAWLERFLLKKGLLAATSWCEAQGKHLALYAQLYGVDLELISPDTERFSTRGGTAQGMGTRRTVPCWMTHDSIAIDYQGNIKMCCNVVSEVEEHRRYILGNVRHDDVLELWSGKRFSAFRSGHSVADWSLSPICESCSLMKERAGVVSEIEAGRHVP